MSLVGNNIQQLINEQAPSFNLFGVGNTIDLTEGVMQFYVDSETVLNMSVVVEFTRHINTLLETMDLGENKFLMEIGSPGADRPFVYLKQMHKHIGKTMQISNNNQEIEGVLTAIKDQQMTLLVKTYQSPKSKKFTEETETIEWNETIQIKVKLAY